jgi:hypothetical protein
MANESNEKRANADGPKPSGFISIEGWKRRQPLKISAAPTDVGSTKEILRQMTRREKQAALLKLIMSDTAEETDLDAMIQTAVSLAARRGGPG